MKIKTQKTAEKDRLILVDSNKLMLHASEEDLSYRNSAIVEDAYHKDWFYHVAKFLYFIPPAASIRDGEIHFINGRHRAILLSRHLEKFPFLIGNIDHDHFGGVPKESSLQVFHTIKADDFEEHTIFDLPDLSFGDFEPA